MTWPGCSKSKSRKKKARKHTPIVSDKQQGTFGAAYGAKKAGRSKPRYVPQSLWEQPKTTLKGHLKESKGKSLPRTTKFR